MKQKPNNGDGTGEGGADTAQGVSSRKDRAYRDAAPRPGFSALGTQFMIT